MKTASSGRMKNRSVNLRDAFAVRKRWNLTIETKIEILAALERGVSAGTHRSAVFLELQNEDDIVWIIIRSKCL